MKMTKKGHLRYPVTCPKKRKKTTCADGEKYLAARTPLAGQKLLEAEIDVTWRVNIMQKMQPALNF